MKFLIKRTSLWDDEVAPCEEVYKEEYIRIDKRLVNDPALIHPYGQAAIDEWFSEGENHRHDEDGLIVRDFRDFTWVLEIDSLEELVKFIDKYGEVIIGRYHFNKSLIRIEIYDDYRE